MREAVSTWLTTGVPATTVAAWAGHSVEVLLKIYAKCLDGEDVHLRTRVEGVLRGGVGDQHFHVFSVNDRTGPVLAGHCRTTNEKRL